MDGKVHYDGNREASKIYMISSTKTYENGYLTGKKNLPPDQSKIIIKTIIIIIIIYFSTQDAF